MKAIPLNRRRFLKLAAGGASAAAVGFPDIVPARVFGAGAPSNRIRVAQIGCGRIAQDMDLPGILRHQALARVVAVADVDSWRAGWGRQKVLRAYEGGGIAKPAVEVYGDYREILARADIDAVMISTPDHWHAQPVVEAALAGKDIYVQKPLSLTVAEGRLVSDVVRAHRRVLQIGSQQRSAAQFHRACELVRNGVVGTLRAVEIGLPTDPPGGNGAPAPLPPHLNYDAWLGGAPRAPYAEDRVHPQSAEPARRFSRPGWLRLNAYTCGMITGWGSHHVDIAHWGMGQEYGGPATVSGEAQWPGRDRFWDVHGPYSIRLTYARGIALSISDQLPNGVRFLGADGWIWVSRGDPNSSSALNASDPGLLKIPASELKTRLHRSPHWDHHLDWLEAIRMRREATTNAETGHRSCSACLLAWIGMRLGRPLRWDAKQERFDGDAEANRLLDRPEREPYGAFRAAQRAGFTEFKSLRFARA